MKKMRFHSLLLAVIGMVSSLGVARANFIPIPQPDAAYLVATSVLPITDPDFTALSSLSDGVVSVTFSTDVVALTVPTTWATWGAPPNTESASPRVLWTQGDTALTLDFSRPVGIFGLELQPNTALVSPVTADFYSFGNLVGTITLDVDGFGGAKLFAATTNPDPFTSIQLFSPDDFALANIRVGGIVPEPGLVTLLAGMSVSGLVASRRRRR
jgi:hypothetical protein